MLSMCGVLCRVLRGWRHQEAVSLMASALAQPDASFLVHDIAALNMGLVQVHEPGGTSSFCQNSTECSVEYIIWRDNNKQAVVIKPRQCVDLMRWTLFIHLDNLSEEATTSKPHQVEQQNPVGDPNIAMNGSSKQQDNCVNRLAVLLEASYYDHGEEFKEDPIMVEHLGQPYAWKARDTFGVIVMTTPTQLLTMVRAFFTNSLIMDDDFIVTKILTVDLIGEASTLSDPTSIPETVTPGPWTRPTSGRTQLEIARSLTPRATPGRQSPVNDEDGLLGSKNLHPVTSTKINPSHLSPTHHSEPPSESEGSNYDMSALCPRAWAFSGYHVVSGQPLPRTLANFSKTCVMTNPMEELWSDKYYNTMVAADNRINEERDGGITDNDKEKVRGTCDIGGPGCLPLCKEGKEMADPSECINDSSFRKESQLTSSKTFMRDEMAKNAKAKVKAQSLKRLHKLSQSQSVELPSPSHSFSFGSENVCVNIITAEPKKYPFRISSDSDLGRATSMIKDNLTNIVENYLIKSRSSKDEVDEVIENEVFTKSTSLGSISKAKPISEIKYQSTASDSSLESFLYKPLTSQPESLTGLHESEEEVIDGTRIEVSSLGPCLVGAQESDTVSMNSSHADGTLNSIYYGLSESKGLGYENTRELMDYPKESDDQMTLADFVAHGFISPSSMSECKMSQGSDDISGNQSFDEDFLSTESVLGSSHAEDRILKSAMTLEDVEQTPLDMADDVSQEIDANCDQAYNQEQEVVAGVGSFNKCLLSPVDSVPESGFSSLKEPEVSEVDNCSSYPNVRISKSKDSLDLTDTDKCLPTDTLSDDMETLSSNAGDATLVESGVVSTEGSARGSFSESHNFDANLGHLANNESNSMSDFDLIDLSLNFKKQISESTDTLTHFDLSKIDDASYETVSSSTSDTTKAKKLQPTRSSSSDEPSLAISRSEKDEAICSAMKPSESLSSADTIVSRDQLEDSGSKASSCHDDLKKIVMKESLESQDSLVFDNSPEKDTTIETVLEQENDSGEEKIEMERENKDTEQLALDLGDLSNNCQGTNKSTTIELRPMEEESNKTRDETGTPMLTSIPPVTIETDQCLITVREASSCSGVGDVQETKLIGSKNMTGQDAVDRRLLDPVGASISKENTSTQSSDLANEPNEKSPCQDNLSARFDLFGRKFSDCSISELEDKVFLSPDQEVRDLASCIRYGVGMREAYLILDTNKAQKADAISDEKNEEAYVSKVSLQDTEKKESIKCITGLEPDLRVQDENQAEATAVEVHKGKAEMFQLEETGSKENNSNSIGMSKKLIESVDEARCGREEDVTLIPKKEELDQDYNCSAADEDCSPRTERNNKNHTNKNDSGEAAAVKLQKEAFNTQKCTEASRAPIQLVKDSVRDDPSMRKELDIKQVEYLKTSERDCDTIARGTGKYANKDDKMEVLEGVLKTVCGNTKEELAQAKDVDRPVIIEDKNILEKDRDEASGKDFNKTTIETDVNKSFTQDMSKTVSEKGEDKGLMKALKHSIEKDLHMASATEKIPLSKTVSENKTEASRRRESCGSKKIKLPKQIEAVCGQEVPDECLNTGAGLPKLVRESAVVDEDLENIITAHSVEGQPEPETLLVGSQGNKGEAFSDTMVDHDQKSTHQKDKLGKESQCNGKPDGPRISGLHKDNHKLKQNAVLSANEPHISTSKNIISSEQSPVGEVRTATNSQKVEKSKKKSLSSPILNTGSRAKKTPALGVIKARQSSGTSAESSISSESKETSSNSPSLSRVTSSSTDGLGDVWQVTRPRGNTMESSSAKSDAGSFKSDVLSLKSEGSLDKFPHFDAVTAQVKARGARKKTVSLDVENKTSSEREKLRDSIHRSATLPVGNVSPVSKKEDKKREKEERSKKKKDKDKSGSSAEKEKKSSMLSLKGLLKRSKVKEKDKSKDSSDEKLSSPSFFRKLERKSKNSPKSSKGNENRTTQLVPASVEGMSEVSSSNPNLCRNASPFVRGMPHSSSFTASPYRRPHSSTSYASPAKRPYVMAAGGLPSGGEPGTPLKSVKEEEYVACRKNVDTDLEKPPNVLIYAANKVEYFESVRDTLYQCLNPDRYTLYHLTDEIAFKSPWLSSTTLLIVCGDVPAHVSTSFIRYLLMGGRVLSICSDFLNVAIPLFGTVEVQEEAVVSMSYRRWPSVQLLHHQHCFHSSPKNKRFSCNLENKKEQSKSAVSVEPTHVEIRDEYGHHHRLDLRVLATDDTWGAPSLLAASVAINKGKAIFSQVHLERDPRECGSEVKDKKKLEVSNNARLEILRDLLSNELNLDVSSIPVCNFGPAYFLGTHELQKGMLQKLEPHMVGKELKRPDLTLRFLSIKEKPGVATEDKMPVIMNACPRNFSTVKYFETLKTSWLGRLVLYSDVMVSSMQVAKGHPPLSHGLVVVPNQQTGGKGRGGNAWLSPLGCAMFTVHLHIALASNLGQHITFVQHLVAMAVVRALRHLPGYQDIPLRLKWPNDVYFDSETKIGGVIVDSSTVGKEVIVNAGCGVNLSNSNPTVCVNDLICQYNEEHGTNLKEIDRETFLALIFNQLEDLINTFQSRGPEAVVPDYYQWWLHGNQSVVVQDVKGQTQPAVITGIDNFGFLEARLESGPVISLQPDGNSFDMMQGLIYTKMH